MSPSLIPPIPRANSFLSRFIMLFLQNRPISCQVFYGIIKSVNLDTGNTKTAFLPELMPVSII